MADSSPILTNFTSGELSPRLNGRIDMDKYYNGASTISNFTVLMHGGLSKRPGTRHIAEIKTSSGSNSGARLISFTFSKTQAYILEFGHNYIRFFKDEGQITESNKTITGITAANPAVVTSNSHGYSNGDFVIITGVVGMTQVNGKTFKVADKTTNTFELQDVDGTDINSSAYTAYSSGGVANKIYQITTTYTAAQLDELEFVQSADVLYIVHESHKPRKLSRTGHTVWTLTDITFVDGPFNAPNLTSTTLTPSGTSGSVTVTASTSIFTSNDVGRKVRIKHSSTWGVGEITAYGSGTSVTVSVDADRNYGGTGAVTDWRLGAFYIGNYPTKVTFYEERLFYANTASHPNTVWGSSTADFDTFSPTETDGTLADDNAVSFTLSSDQVNQITGMYGGKYLHLFTKNGTFNLSSGSATQGLTATTVQVINETGDGAADKKVMPASKSVLYIGKNKKRLREFAYNIDYDSYTSPDMSVLSEHLGYGGMEEAVFANYPNNILWVRRGDGKLLGFTYYRDQGVTAWHQHTLAGTNAKVKSIAVIPGINDAFDTLYMIVERTINSVTRQYVEFMEEEYREADGHTKDDAFYLDSALTYSGGSTSTITGLDHLEGQTVTVLNNGAVEATKTVSSGSITLTNATTKCHVGLAYNAELESVNVEPKSQYGTTQGKRGRIDKCIFRVFETVGLKAGPSSTSVDVVPFRTTTSTMSATTPKTGDYTFLMPASYTTENKLYVKSDTPHPCTISAIMIQMSTYD